MDGDYCMHQVLAGECLGSKSPIETRFPLTYLDVRMQPHGKATSSTHLHFCMDLLGSPHHRCPLLPPMLPHAPAAAPPPLPASFRQPVPSELNSFIYVYRGRGQAGKERTALQEGQAGVLGKQGDAIDLHTTVRQTATPPALS